MNKMGVFSELDILVKSGASVPEIQAFLMRTNGHLDKWDALALAQKYHKG